MTETEQPTAHVVPPEVKLQQQTWRRLVVILALAFFAQSCAFGWYLQHETAKSDDQQAVTNCRGLKAANLSTATATNDLAFNDLVVAIANRTTDPAKHPTLPEAIADLETAGTALRATADDRRAFEDHPSTKC